MGWGVALLLIWAVVLTGGFLWLLARTVALAAARKRHTVFSHLKHIEELGTEECYIARDGMWVRDDEAHRRGCYRT